MVPFQIRVKLLTYPKLIRVYRHLIRTSFLVTILSDFIPFRDTYVLLVVRLVDPYTFSPDPLGRSYCPDPLDLHPTLTTENTVSESPPTSFCTSNITEFYIGVWETMGEVFYPDLRRGNPHLT